MTCTQAGADHGRHLKGDNRRALLEGKVDHVIGVDTHRDAHTAAILDPNGGVVAELEVPSDQAGYEQLVGFVSQHAPGRRCWALEAPAATAPGWPASSSVMASG